MRMRKGSIKAAAIAVTMLFAFVPLFAANANDGTPQATIDKVAKINPTTVEVDLHNKEKITIDFYGENIFRLFRDNKGGILRDPVAVPEAKILVGNPRREVKEITVNECEKGYTITTSKIEIAICKENGLMKVKDLTTGKTVIEEAAPALFKNAKTTLTLKSNPGEYYYGGGVQNGRFSHKGNIIAIENQNSWTDGGVASPTPFFWSTGGYGFMWHTFKKGTYDFGATKADNVTLMHEIDYLDVFFMVNSCGIALLNDFYQLTGEPVLIPKFGFYEGHLNAYNRDYWKENAESGFVYEDGKRYKENQTDNGGIKESLNGEFGKEQYQFSARAVIDRYEAHDMPLGWILPNDGYGCGYGQTETIDGNIQNLKEFGDYAHSKGVEVGLWTESNLYPRESVNAILQRDIVKEVRDAGVRVLKTDVAWVGAGYSFGLNGVTDVAQIMTYYGNNARPFIISVDGWAGTQRYAGIWTGDQSGGEWEYIRFHIPTYIGSGLSGQPNITSDVDGIFGGSNIPVNIREFQWKAYTPMMLNMDGWGSSQKYPHVFGDPAESINRSYLKMKAEIMPYAYSIAREAINGKPMIRAMFLDYPNEYTQGSATRYQFLYGPYFLVAPIYQETAMDKDGNDIRNGIYLPEGTWIDYFTGEKYNGNCIVNNFDAPLWKLPLFVKAGAIIPVTTPHNTPAQVDNSLRMYELYPAGETSFTEYDDDGTTELYRAGHFTETKITSACNEKGIATITIAPTTGSFNGFVKEKTTIFKVNVSEAPKKVSAKVGKKSIKLTEVSSIEEFEKGENVYFYDAAPNLNRFATEGSEFAKVEIIKNPVVMVKLAKSDVTAAATTLTVKGYKFDTPNSHLKTEGTLEAPKATLTDENRQPYTLTPSWEKVAGADYYEIEFEGRNYTTIKNCELLFEDLKPETSYKFSIRAVNKSGASEWTTIESTTKNNPLEFALKGLSATTTCRNQGGQGPNRLFDFEEGNIWHTVYGENSVPFDMIIDLNGLSTLDKLHYLGREDSGNGTITAAQISYSTNKENWSEPVAVKWERTPDTKVFTFDGNPKARFVKIHVSEAVGNFGSGREMYIFKVAGTETFLPGDINKDKKVDENDLTSYMNYTGLRNSDSDFEYVSIGDMNENGIIDAYDISVAATRIDDGAYANPAQAVAGTITIAADKKNYKAGEEVTLTIKGTGLANVNAFGFAIPYDSNDYEYVTVNAMNTANMENYTKNRLHGNGTTAVYPTFVNVADQPTLNGDVEIATITLKAKKNIKFNLKATDGVIVDKNLNCIKF
ncbi:MAG: DUF5110 domain-containing protein [Bacteroidaceae bacterium]|nr:DUF5110 domain-containing protein [Bacteroidaceae bacterium]